MTKLNSLFLASVICLFGACCSKFQPECRNKYPNITIKKILKVLLETCEFDRDDYSLNIVSVPEIETEDLEDTEDNFDDQPNLFNS